MKGMRLFAWCTITLILSSCATSRVIRTAPAPVRVSAPKYGATAVVHAGDTLYHVATTHGISVLDLAVWNDIAPPYTIYPGQRLRLYPRERSAVRPTNTAAAPRTTTTAPAAPG